MIILLNFERAALGLRRRARALVFVIVYIVTCGKNAASISFFRLSFVWLKNFQRSFCKFKSTSGETTVTRVLTKSNAVVSSRSATLSL